MRGERWLWTDEKAERLRALRAEGHTNLRIAEIMNVSVRAVEAKVEDFDLTRRGPVVWTPDEDVILRRMRQDREPNARIAAALPGRTEKAIMLRSKYLGLPSYGRREWADDMIATLRACAARGLHAREIGAEIGKSKSAVIACAARAGIKLMDLPFSGNPQRARSAPEVPAKRKGGVPPRPTAGLESKAGGNSRALEASYLPDADCPPTDDPFSDKGCRWPVGDIAAGTFRFCQAEQDAREGGARHSYCARHRKMARAVAPGVSPKKAATARVRTFETFAPAGDWA